MSIYHCSIKIIGRNGGRSAVSAAAYRSGEKLTSDETGIIHDYTRKGGVIMNEIILPDNAPDRLLDREVLWNEVQQVEKRADAQFAREVEVAFPNELSREEQIECVRDFIKENFTSKGMIADWALHDKGDGNPHAHIMLTVREINEEEGWQSKQTSVFANGRDKNGKAIYDPSKPSYDPKDREHTSQYRIPALDENGKQKTRVRKGKGTEYLWERISIPANDWNEHSKCEQWRKSWAEHCNRYLPPELHIDHRSYERQGLEIEPTIHEGVTARQMEKEGKTSERCEINRDIKKRNRLREELVKSFKELSELITKKVRRIYERITKLFENRKSGRNDIGFGNPGRAYSSYGRVGEGERGSEYNEPDSAEPNIQIGEYHNRTETNSSGERGRDRRAGKIERELEQRESETLFTDEKIEQTDRDIAETDIRIAELKRIKTEKEQELHDRIRAIMERRGTGVTAGTDAEGERQPSGREQQAEDTEQDSFLREVRAAISSARANEGIADKEREAREAEQVRLDREREREAERERQAERERAERDKAKKRRRDHSR